MSHRSPLERRYRRWLAFYPPSFRAEHEEEMVGVLMQAAEPDQSHPRPTEAANLATHGVGQRARRHFPGEWERAHARIMFPVRLAIALWLCFITAVLIGFDQGQLWLIVTVPAIGAHLYIAYKIRPGLTRS